MVTDTAKQKRARDQAETWLNKPTQAYKDKATADYEAAAQAVRDRTARLRALRLAKEAADEKAAVKKKKPAAPKKKPRS